MQLSRINKISLITLLLIVTASSSAFAWGMGADCPCPQAFACGIGSGCPCGENPARWDARDDLTSDQKDQLAALNQKFIDDTAETRIALNTAYKNLAVLMRTSDPDRKSIQSVLKEISALSATLMEKQVDYQLEARKIAPDAGTGNMFRRCPKNDKPGCMRDSRKVAPGTGCPNKISNN
ncbi:MAG: periplasmic heavy metal sensor [Thermodesulfobacteriota bacterium]